MTMYRKRPVVVDATQWLGPDDDGVNRLAEWAGLDGLAPTHSHGIQPADEPWAAPEWPLWVWCAASKAMVTIRVGDWLIREPDGSGVYPCRSADFAAGFEPEDGPLGSGVNPADPAGNPIQSLESRLATIRAFAQRWPWTGIADSEEAVQSAVFGDDLPDGWRPGDGARR